MYVVSMAPVLACANIFNYVRGRYGFRATEPLQFVSKMKNEKKRGLNVKKVKENIRKNEKRKGDST